MPAATAGAPDREVGGKFPPREARRFPRSWSGDAAAERQPPGEPGQVDLNSEHDLRKTETPGCKPGHLLGKKNKQTKKI